LKKPRRSPTRGGGAGTEKRPFANGEPNRPDLFCQPFFWKLSIRFPSGSLFWFAEKVVYLSRPAAKGIVWENQPVANEDQFMRVAAVVKLIYLGILGSSFVVSSLRADNTRKVTSEEVAARIRQAKAGEGMAWTRIPWTASLVEARRASQEENRPLFLFTLDGNIGTGRC
jgi:hypothetical protein